MARFREERPVHGHVYILYTARFKMNGVFIFPEWSI